MDPSKLKYLRQIEIPNPCHENWDGMEGGEAKRFCAGCGCFVHNLAEMDADSAEALLSGNEKVCTRLTIDAKRGMKTRDGWIPRIMLAGALAATVATASATPEAPQKSKTKKQTESTGWHAIVAKKKQPKKTLAKKPEVHVVMGAMPLPPRKEQNDPKPLRKTEGADDGVYQIEVSKPKKSVKPIPKKKGD